MYSKNDDVIIIIIIYAKIDIFPAQFMNRYNIININQRYH